MRVTNQMMTQNLLANLNRGMKRMDKTNRQLATGQRIQAPSDDPVGAVRMAQMRVSYNENNQYLQNVEDGLSWLEGTDSVLDKVVNVLHRVRELAVYGANEPIDREPLADEVEQLFDNLIQQLNTTHGNRYLLAGQKTRTQPFRNNWDGDPPFVREPGIEGALELEIGHGTAVQINVVDSEDDGFISETLAAIHRIHGYMMDDDLGELQGTALEDLDRALERVLKERSETGAKINRLELTRERLSEMKINLTQLRSELEDVDVAEMIMHLKEQENVYRTALSVGARIIQPSLVDFLR